MNAGVKGKGKESKEVAKSESKNDAKSDQEEKSG